MSTRSIFLCGVGGQGTLLASNLIAECLVRNGFDVRKSEVHGMAQRGGSVSSHIRFGEKVYSPLIREGEAEILIAFEQLEAARWSQFLKPGGKMLVNTQKIMPMSVSAGDARYPDGILESLGASGSLLHTIDALKIAGELGNKKCINIVMIGLLASLLNEIPVDSWRQTIRETFNQKIVDVNLKGFEAGLSRSKK